MEATGGGREFSVARTREDVGMALAGVSLEIGLSWFSVFFLNEKTFFNRIYFLEQL